jgi:hypothetical protein
MQNRSRDMMHLARGGSLSPAHWDEPEKFDALVDNLVEYYRENGYPKLGSALRPLSIRKKRRMFAKLVRLHVESLITEEGIVKQDFCAQQLSWSYFPHSLGVVCRAFSGKHKGYNTVNSVMADERLLRKALKGVLNMAKSANSGFSHVSFANRLKISQGTQHVSNFRPSAAKAIYQRYARGKVVWDMSCGFGGRLLGAMAAPVKKYIGTDPSTKTIEGLKKIREELGSLSTCKIKLYKIGSEDFLHKEGTEKYIGKVDFCFTSPPYFDTEKYSDEDTQSYKKFPTADSWLNEFVKRTIRNCWKSLHPNGILAFNIHAGMEKDFLKLCKKGGFRHLETLQLRLSRMPGRGGRDKEQLYKNEPILVFQKES